MAVETLVSPGGYLAIPYDGINREVVPPNEKASELRWKIRQCLRASSGFALRRQRQR